jgi:hypothetical protein
MILLRGGVSFAFLQDKGPVLARLHDVEIPSGGVTFNGPTSLMRALAR